MTWWQLFNLITSLDKTLAALFKKIDLIDHYGALLISRLDQRLDAQGVTLEAHSARHDMGDLDRAEQAEKVARLERQVFTLQRLDRTTRASGRSTARWTVRPAGGSGRRRGRATTESAG